MNGFKVTLKLKDPEETLRHLEEQLGDYHEDSVPLAVLNERVTSQVFKDLQTLTEVLPSFDDARRKGALLEFVGTSGRRLLRLAAVIRWATHSEALQKCTNMAGFLGNQTFQFELAWRTLQTAHASLLNARVRNYDVPNALDILQTGTFQRLPSVLQTYGASDPTTKDEMLAILRTLNKAIKRRLAIFEAVPLRMRSYHVESGRVWFTVDGLFKAALTLGGEDVNDRWYLVQVDFLKTAEEVADDCGACELLPPLPEQIVEAGNQLLAGNDPRNPEAPPQPPPLPLYRLCTLLENLALNFRLERLISQAVRFSHDLAYKGHLRIDLARDRRSFELFYWIDQGIKPTMDKKSAPELPSILFQVERDCPLDNPTQYLQSLSIKQGAPETFSRLSKLWRPGSLAVKTPVAEEVEPSFELAFRKIIARHVDLSTRALYAQLMGCGQFQKGQVRPRMVGDKATGLCVRLYGTIQILVRISEATGRIEFVLDSEETEAALESRIAKAARAANDNRDALPEVLLGLRAGVIAHSLECKVAYLGLPWYKRPPLRLSDIQRFGSGQLPFLVALKGFPSFFFVILIGEIGLRFAIISTTQIQENVQSFFAIQEIGYIQAEKLGLGSCCQEISSDLLQRLYTYSLLRICLFKVEQQLFARRIPYAFVSDRASPAAVGLILRTDRLLSVPTKPYLHKYAFIRAQFKGNAAPCLIAFYAKIRSKYAKRAINLPEHAELTAEGLLTFKPHKNDNALHGVLSLLSSCIKQFQELDVGPPCIIPA